MLKIAFQENMPKTPLQKAPETSDPLSFDQALALFDELSNVKTIPYAHLENGCHLRASVMCDLMVKSGYAPMKAWMFNGKSDLCHISPKGEKAVWWFHVAPTLKVALAKGDEAEPLVFDPSLYDGPVTVQEWCKPIITSAPAATEVYISAYNKCLKQQYSRDLEKFRGWEWDSKVSRAIMMLRQLDEPYESSAVFKSSLRACFNQAAGQAPAEPKAFTGPDLRARPHPIFIG